MSTVTTITSVSDRYYRKRGKLFIQQRIMELAHVLGDDQPLQRVLNEMSVDSLIRWVLEQHSRLPEDL